MKQLTANLVAFVKEVRAIPATPILVTSLSRRRFNSSGKVTENLADVTAAAKAAASQSGATIIDLSERRKHEVPELHWSRQRSDVQPGCNGFHTPE